MSCWCLLSCTWLCQNRCQYWLGQGRQCWNTPRRISKLYQNNDVCIDWPLCLADMSTVEHVCVGHFWTEGTTHTAGNNNPPGSWCDVTGGLDTKSPELVRVCKASRVLICRWLGTHSLLKAFCSSKRDIYGHHVNLLWHSKEFNFKFWKLTAYSCV